MGEGPVKIKKPGNINKFIYLKCTYTRADHCLAPPNFKVYGNFEKKRSNSYIFVYLKMKSVRTRTDFNTRRFLQKYLDLLAVS